MPKPLPGPNPLPSENDDDAGSDKASLGWIIGGVLGGVPLLLLVMLYAIKAWRRLAPCWATSPQMYRVSYRTVLDYLAEVGMVRHCGETREEFAQRLAGMAPSLPQMTAAHVRRAVGVRDDLDPLGWRDMQRAVKADIVRQFSLTRRLLGLLNPVSWLAAR
jgi:protein-glutamine gamma-glutamyltransferase